MDSRPAIPLEGWIKSLGSAELLTKIYLPRDERSRRNVLCGAAPTSFVRHLSCFHPSLESEPVVYGCLATLAMGDTQAVNLAQTSHVSLALRSGAAWPENLLMLCRPIPRGPDYVGIVIDDFVSLSETAQSFHGLSDGSLFSRKIEEKYKLKKLVCSVIQKRGLKMINILVLGAWT